jgi:hypothetical protein
MDAQQMDTRGSEPASNHYVHGYLGLPSSASESRGVPHNAHSLMHQPSAAGAHPQFGYTPGSLQGQQHIGMSIDNQPEQLMEELQWRYMPHPPNVNNHFVNLSDNYAHSITTPLCHNGDKNMLPNVYNEPGQGVNNLSSNDRFKNTTTYNTLNINVTGVFIYSLFLLVDTLLYLLTLYGRSDITDVRPYVACNLLHNHFYPLPLHLHSLE